MYATCTFDGYDRKLREECRRSEARMQKSYLKNAGFKVPHWKAKI